MGENVIDHAGVARFEVFPQEADTEHTTDGDMRRADRQAKLAGDDDGNGGRHGDAEGPRLVELGDFRADGTDQLGPEQGQPEADADGADHHHPERNLGRLADRALAQHIGNAGQRADGVGDIVGAVGETQERRREYQRDGEHHIDARLVVRRAGVRLPGHARAHHDVGEQRDDTAGQGRFHKAHLEHRPHALEHQVGGKGPGHAGDQQGNDAARRGHDILAVENPVLDEIKETGGDQAAHQGRNDPAGGDRAHGSPVGDTPATGRDPRAEDTADDGMSGRHRCPGGSGDIEPDGAGKQRGKHQPDEDIGIGHRTRRDDAAPDGRYHVAAGDQRTSRFEDGGDDQGAAQAQGARADSRPDIVGHVVGADVQGHVAADHAGDDEHDVAAARGPGIEHDADDEEQRQAETEQFGARFAGGLFDVVDVPDFHNSIQPQSNPASDDAANGGG